MPRSIFAIRKHHSTGVVRQEHQDKNLAEIIKTVLRLNTYGNDSDIQSIGSAFRQIYSASVGGATYLDCGWQTLVDWLEMSAKEHKARIVTGKKAIRVEKRSRDSSDGE